MLFLEVRMNLRVLTRCMKCAKEPCFENWLSCIFSVLYLLNYWFLCILLGLLEIIKLSGEAKGRRPDLNFGPCRFFRTKNFQKCFLDHALHVRKLGPTQARATQEDFQDLAQIIPSCRVLGNTVLDLSREFRGRNIEP